jgi:hypothetical protein
MSGPPLTPGGSIGRTQPLRRPQQSADGSRYDRNSEEENTQLENLEAQEVMRKEMYGPHEYETDPENEKVIRYGSLVLELPFRDTVLWESLPLIPESYLTTIPHLRDCSANLVI